ncbi:MAG TPA: hypothetical protein VFB14_13910 [Bryobacteraceae bacterium]|jgi:hypothetical protein|nr:hypothetical protein [Bryobacteraceae bacterium]
MSSNKTAQKKTAAAQQKKPANRPPAGNRNPGGTARTGDAEANAISVCLEALRPLQPEARQRVMDYARVRFKLTEQGENAGIETVTGAGEGARSLTAAS